MSKRGINILPFVWKRGAKLRQNNQLLSGVVAEAAIKLGGILKLELVIDDDPYKSRTLVIEVNNLKIEHPLVPLTADNPTYDSDQIAGLAWAAYCSKMGMIKDAQLFGYVNSGSVATRNIVVDLDFRSRGCTPPLDW